MISPADIPADYGPGAGVLDGVTGANHVTESPLAAPDVNPYFAGAPQPIYTGGAPDDVAGSVAEAVANAEARFTGRQSETYGLGSVIGDPVGLSEVPTAHSKHAAGGGAGYESG